MKDNYRYCQPCCGCGCYEKKEDKNIGYCSWNNELVHPFYTCERFEYYKPYRQKAV